MEEKNFPKRLSSFWPLFNSWRIYKFILGKFTLSSGAPAFRRLNHQSSIIHPVKSLQSNVRSNLTGVNHKSFRGFTLIELLVVVAMVGVLFSFLLLFINPFKQIDKARDAQRQENLTQINNSLDTFYNDKNCYPNSVPFGSALEIGSTVYMKKIPQDPSCLSGGKCFAYLSDNSSCPQWNVLFAKLSSVATLTIACPLTQLINCLPSNYSASGYNYCTLSGKADCNSIRSQLLP